MSISTILKDTLKLLHTNNHLNIPWCQHLKNYLHPTIKMLLEEEISF